LLVKEKLFSTVEVKGSHQYLKFEIVAYQDWSTRVPGHL
jgi:hypothetical protein